MKSKIMLVIGLLMMAFAIGFAVYAFNNPQGSFPWSNLITYSIYALYLVIMICCFVMSIALRKERFNTHEIAFVLDRQRRKTIDKGSWYL